ncbi:MAG: 4'-phosphopantetheinyl transferase superfamily protein [Rhodobacteraceae bacterium]|nr:MAG: 4'-phosphopantetheinyl transferase superfamily protein [Paracoccaceae bacterium]
MAPYAVAAYDDADFARWRLVRPGFLARAVPKRRAEYLAGRAVARQALARLGLQDCKIGRGDRGEPLWPAGVTGSLSHSHGTVGAWVATDGALLGLDIEALADTRATRAIRHSVLMPEDLAGLGPDPDAATCTAVFSAKEALYKALYPRVRRFFGFDHAHVVAIGPSGVTLRLAKPLAADLPAGLTIDIAQQWRAGRVISRCEIAP